MRYLSKDIYKKLTDEGKSLIRKEGQIFNDLKQTEGYKQLEAWLEMWLKPEKLFDTMLSAVTKDGEGEGSAKIVAGQIKMVRATLLFVNEKIDKYREFIEIETILAKEKELKKDGKQ